MVSMALLVETLIENLINEIEKRPALYKKTLKEYLDANLKKKLWLEVCEAVVPDWNQLNAEEKTKQGNDVQNKWANLRTCFRRELNAQKSTKSGQAATKRRRYVYFEQLLFLLPCMENRQTEGNLEPDDNEEDDDDNDESGPTTSTLTPRRKKRTNVPKQTDLDEALVKALTESNTIDEDTNFALSLVPSLQNLTAGEKLDAKIGILNIFKEIRLARRDQTTSQSSYNYNIIQQPSSSFPVYHRGTNILSPPQSLQPCNTPRSTPSPLQPVVQNIQDTPSPGYSNDTSQSNFSTDSQFYDL